MYKPMKIFTLNSRSVNVLLHTPQNMIAEFKKLLVHFFVQCGFGIAFLLDNTGQSWELHGPHTTLCPEHILASAHSPRHQVWEEVRYRQWPAVNHWISPVQQMDLPGRHPFAESKGWEYILKKWEEMWLWDLCLRNVECMFPVRNQLKCIILWSHRSVKVPTSDWSLTQQYADLRALFIWKRAHSQSVNGFCNSWMLAVF